MVITSGIIVLMTMMRLKMNVTKVMMNKLVNYHNENEKYDNDIDAFI